MYDRRSMRRLMVGMGLALIILSLVLPLILEDRAVLYGKKPLAVGGEVLTPLMFGGEFTIPRIVALCSLLAIGGVSCLLFSLSLRTTNGEHYVYLHVKIDKELRERFIKKCRRLGLSPSETIRLLIEGFLE